MDNDRISSLVVSVVAVTISKEQAKGRNPIVDNQPGVEWRTRKRTSSGKETKSDRMEN